MTSRRPGGVDVSVVDVAVDGAQYSTSDNEHDQDEQPDKHQQYVSVPLN